jgi:type II secretory pathway component PulJ
MRSRRNERGLTLVEVAVASAIGVMILGLGVTLTNSSLRDSNAIFVRTSLSTRAAAATEQVTKDLQVATLMGEDENGNQLLDANEDTNRNGVLDANWSLKDGGTANAITFNTVMNGYLWGPPVTWYVQDGVLLRRDSAGDREICRGVEAFQVTRSGSIVDVDLTLTASDRQGKKWTETSRRRAHVRN